MSLSDNIRKYRTGKGYTQEQLASLLGISAQAVSKWETTETYPDGALLLPLANALDVSLDTLFGRASASVREISEEMRQLLSSVPAQNEFSAAMELCWHLEKALFNNRMTVDDPYDPDERTKLCLSSYILNDHGFTYVSNSRSPFFALVPENGDSLSAVIGDGEELRRIFAALSSPETIRAVLFLHRNTPDYVFEKEVLTHACRIPDEDAERVIGDLTDLQLITASGLEIDGEHRTLYYSRPSHLLILLFLLAHEMNYKGGYCFQSHYRKKPFLTDAENTQDKT